MVKQVKSAANKLAKLVKSNRILMIVCVFLVMGLAITLINYLQNKTLERFASAYTLTETTEELNAGNHGSKHMKCDHKNDTSDHHHLCGHVHGSNAVNEAKKLVNGSYGTYNNAQGYTVNGETGSLSAINA